MLSVIPDTPFFNDYKVVVSADKEKNLDNNERYFSMYVRPIEPYFRLNVIQSEWSGNNNVQNQPISYDLMIENVGQETLVNARLRVYNEIGGTRTLLHEILIGNLSTGQVYTTNLEVTPVKIGAQSFIFEPFADNFVLRPEYSPTINYYVNVVPKSMIQNKIDQDIVGKILLKVQKENQENFNWEDFKTVVVDSVARTIHPGEIIALDTEWAEAGYWIPDFNGNYRVYGALLNENNEVININGDYLEYTYPFWVYGGREGEEEVLCTDKTKINTCSDNIPYYCNSDKELVPRCNICLCPFGSSCGESGLCVETPSTCNDGFCSEDENCESCKEDCGSCFVVVVNPPSPGPSSGGGSSSYSPNRVVQTIRNIKAGEIKILEVTDKTSNVDRLSFKLNNDKNYIRITIKKIDQTYIGQGTNYKSFEIELNNIQNNEFLESKIQFRVDKKWLISNGYNKNDIKLKKLVNDFWTDLNTRYIGKENGYYIYDAETKGFSIFSIIAQKIEEETLCGNNILDSGETCRSCSLDIVCQSDEICNNSGICERKTQQPIQPIIEQPPIKVQETPQKIKTTDLILKNYITVLIIGIIILILLIAAIIIYLMSKRKPKYKEEPWEEMSENERRNYERLRNIIQENLSKGYTREEIRKAALDSGWDESLIDKVMRNIK